MTSTDPRSYTILKVRASSVDPVPQLFLSRGVEGRLKRRSVPEEPLTFFSGVEPVGGSTSQAGGTSPLREGIVESVQDGL